MVFRSCVICCIGKQQRQIRTQDMPRHLPPEQVMHAVTLLEEGHTERYVAEQVGVSQSVIWRLWERYRELHTVQRRHGTGRKRKTTPAEDWFFRLQALQNQRSTARYLRGELINAHGTVVNTQIVRNTLMEGQFKSRRTLGVPWLQPHHRIWRLQFAQEHVQWQLRHWAPIFFSDESRFHLTGSDGRIRIWRRERERTLPSTVQETAAYRGGSVMVSGRISFKPEKWPRIHPWGIESCALHSRYSREPSTTHRRIYWAKFHINAWWSPCTFCYRHQGVPWSCGLARMQPRPKFYRVSVGFTRSAYPESTTATSHNPGPDSSIIGRKESHSQNTIRRLIRSVPRRCAVVIRARGGNTEYWTVKSLHFHFVLIFIQVTLHFRFDYFIWTFWFLYKERNSFYFCIT